MTDPIQFEALSLADQLSELVSQRTTLNDLIDSKAWQWLRNHIQEEIDQLVRQAALTKISSLDMILPAEYDKGQLAAKLTFADLPQTLLSGVELEIDNVKRLMAAQAQENEDEPENQQPSE